MMDRYQSFSILILMEIRLIQGKLTARERIDLLFDKGSFREYDAFVEHQCVDFGMDRNKVNWNGSSILLSEGMDHRDPF